MRVPAVELRDLVPVAIGAFAYVLLSLLPHEAGHFFCRKGLDVPVDFMFFTRVATWDQLCETEGLFRTFSGALCTAMGPIAQTGVLVLPTAIGFAPRIGRWALHVAVPIGWLGFFTAVAGWLAPPRGVKFIWSNDMPKTAQQFLPGDFGAHLFSAAFVVALFIVSAIAIWRFRALDARPWRTALLLFLGAGIGYLIAARIDEYWLVPMGTAAHC